MQSYKKNQYVVPNYMLFLVKKRKIKGNGGGVINAVSGIRAVACQPDNVSLAVAYYQRASFLEYREMTVGQVIAHQFGAFHAKRLEAVALSYGSYDQGKGHLAGIERGRACLC